MPDDEPSQAVVNPCALVFVNNARVVRNWWSWPNRRLMITPDNHRATYLAPHRAHLGLKVLYLNVVMRKIDHMSSYHNVWQSKLGQVGS